MDALVLTENQWNNILKWIPSTEKEQQEEKILKYLKDASAVMKAKWPENNKNKSEGTKARGRKLNPEMQRYEAIKNATPEERHAMIKEAEKFVSVRKIKECPIELKSAAILSENLYANKIQLDFQARQKREEKAKIDLRNKIDKIQSVAWLNDGWDHRTNAHRVAKEHREQLIKMASDRKAKKDAEKAARIAEENKIIDHQIQEVKEQKALAKLKQIETYKYMQEHENQTKLMAKQKCDRIKKENEVIDVLVKTHNEGKNKIKEMIKEQENEAKLERIRLNMKLQKMALDRHMCEIKKLQHEQELIEKVKSVKESILDEREEKAKQRKEKLKIERLDDYNQSLRIAKQRKALKTEEDKEYFQTRVINDKISHEYTKIRKELQANKTRDNLNNLKQQAKELRQKDKTEKEEDMRNFNKAYDDDTCDEKFFDYAKDLIDEAERKNRPTKPIMQAIKVYKNRQCIDIKKKTRPHEISNVPIEMEIQKIESNKGKTKRRLKYENDEKKMANAYRGTKFLAI